MLLRCDRDDVQAVTRKVNGGLNGIVNRRVFLHRAEAARGGKPADLIAPSSSNPDAADGIVGRQTWWRLVAGAPPVYPV